MTTDSFNLECSGTALVVSGPSGAGKTTVCRLLMARTPGLHFSVSCTTRAPRSGEENGKDYYFLDPSTFMAKVDAGEFLEHARVHGNLYGTLRSEAEQYVRRGADVLLDIDVQGARQVRRSIAGTPLATVFCFVFIGPPSYAEMERRLRGRGTESEEVIQRRLGNGRDELAAWREYDYLVINDIPEAAADRLDAVLRASRCAAGRISPGTAWPYVQA